MLFTSRDPSGKKQASIQSNCLFWAAIAGSWMLSGYCDRAQSEPMTVAAELNLDRQIVERSPVLQRWLADPPDLLQDIYNDPGFLPKIRLGITSRDNNIGLDVGVEDVFLGNRSPLTFSGKYQTEFSGKESSYAAMLRYYLLPLGSYANLSPQVGYRQIAIADQPLIAGVDLGLQGILILSPRSADLRLAHTFTAPGTSLETSITTLAASYAFSSRLRLGSSIEWRRSPVRSDSRVGFVLEWSL